MTWLATLVATSWFLAFAFGDPWWMMGPFLNAVQVHRDWATAAVVLGTPKPLGMGVSPEVGVPRMKYIIQGLGILHCLIQVLWIRD